jgi:uncharacterized membrane protein (UPF0127 family)
MASFLSGAAKADGRQFALVDAATGRVVVPRLEFALDSVSRRKGLLGRDGLDPGAGLVIAPSNSVHTFFMRFAIDIVFLHRSGRVLKIRHRVPARRVAVSATAHAVLELPAGAAAAAGISVGATLALQ